MPKSSPYQVSVKHPTGITTILRRGELLTYLRRLLHLAPGPGLRVIRQILELMTEEDIRRIFAENPHNSNEAHLLVAGVEYVFRQTKDEALLFLLRDVCISADPFEILRNRRMSLGVLRNAVHRSDTGSGEGPEIIKLFTRLGFALKPALFVNAISENLTAGSISRVELATSLPLLLKLRRFFNGNGKEVRISRKKLQQLIDLARDSSGSGANR